MLLEKQFIIDKDYKRLLLSQQKQNNASEASGAKKDIRGGHNKEIFLLSVDTFKKFCLHLFSFKTPILNLQGCKDKFIS